MIRPAYLVEGIRTPFGRYGGGLATVRADDLLAHVLATLVKRTGIPADKIDDVLIGCANQAGEDNRNIARQSALLAGLPVSIPGVTTNRLCGSGMQTIADAAMRIQTNTADLVIAGGVEHMSRAPWVMPKTETPFARGHKTIYDTTLGWRFINPAMDKRYGTLSMGETAENVARKYNICRETQDQFAWQSQQKANKAQALHQEEIVSVTVQQKKQTLEIAQDEHPRPNITLEDLAKLRPAFAANGTVTAGNASGLNDGAAAILIASETALRDYNLTPCARYVSYGIAGVAPSYMGMGPVPATKQALKGADKKIQHIDIAEINEAFAAQAIPCIQEIGIDPANVNPNGGAIALGHPLGASGTRIVLTLMHTLRRQNKSLGLATMCIGVGQGIALIIENIANPGSFSKTG